MPHLVAVLPPPAVAGRLRGLGGFDAFGPHITVKALSGAEVAALRDHLETASPAGGVVTER